MGTVLLYNSGGTTPLEKLYQWDRDIVMVVKGLETITSGAKVHFANQSITKALVVTPTNISTSAKSLTVKIPNTLLEEPETIFAYIYDTKSGGRGTTVRIRLPIQPRTEVGANYIEDPSDVQEAMYAIEELNITGNIIAEYITARANLIANGDVYAHTNKKLATEDYVDDAFLTQSGNLSTLSGRVTTLENKTSTLTKDGEAAKFTGDVYANNKKLASEEYVNTRTLDATTSRKGVVQIGSNISVENGVISVPNATASQKGVVSVGNGLQVGNGAVSVNTNIIATQADLTSVAQQAARDAIKISFVDALPPDSNAVAKTIYFVPRGDGYDKYWYVTNEATGTSMWDRVGGSATMVVDYLPESGDEDTDYIVRSGGGFFYYKWIDSDWEIIGGSRAVIITGSFPDPGDEYTDYYKQNESGVYLHYRFIKSAEHPSGAYEVIGSEAYSKSEVDSIIRTLRESLQSQINTNATNVAAVTRALGELSDTVNSMDTEGHVYDVDYRDNTFYFYEGEAGEENEPLRSFVITGGGGGGPAQSTTIVIRRITESPYVRTLNDDVIIRFEYSSTDGDGETVDGAYTWRIDNRVVKTGTLVQGENTFDAKPYFGNIAGTHKLTLSVRDDAGSSATKSWTVQVVDIRIVSDFDDGTSIPIGQRVSFPYTPYGAVSKQVHFILDGEEIDVVTSTRSGVPQYYDLPAKPHGAHLLECFITATINDVPVESNHVYKDIVWFDESSTIPVIGCIYRNDRYHIVENPTAEYLDDYYTLSNGTYTKAPYKTVDEPVTADIGTYYELSGGTYTLTSDTSVGSGKTYYVKEVTDGVTYHSKSVYANQYDTTAIPYYVFSPTTSMPTVTQTADGITNTVRLEGSRDIWRYMSGAIGKHNLVIACGRTSVTISMGIAGVRVNVNPVTANMAFDFNPVGYSNSSSNRLWVDRSNPSVAMSVSNNFNWSDGGYQADDDGTPYFCVKAGTTATFSYPLFQDYDPQKGMEFKLIFKTVNVGSASARFLQCLSEVGLNTWRGLEMNVHEAYLRTDQGTLYVPYSEEDKIEFEFNIEALAEGASALSFIMSYEDGVALRPMKLQNDQGIVHSAVITVGSQDCDVYIYRMKAYTTALTDLQILDNFIADAPNAPEMISRYVRNQITDENGNLTPESVANACPELKVIKIDCPHFTNDKGDFVKNTTVECIHIGGRSTEDNWRFENCYHSGQGTTSNAYGGSARNIDILCNCDGVISPYPGKIDKNGVDRSYITRLILGDGHAILGCKYDECDVSAGDSVAGLYVLSGGDYVLTPDTTARAGVTYYERKRNPDCKVALSDTSVPNNWFNIKTNVASSENANNALLQKRFNDYLPYRAKARDRDDRAKNDMEFFNCVVFLRETDIPNAREFNDGEWHFYAIGNIGDSKKTDATRANDPTDIKEFTIEINDNSGLNQPFTTGVYATYTPVASPSASHLNTYYERDDSLYTLTTDTTIKANKTYYTRGALSYDKLDGSGNLRTPVMPILKEQWENENNTARISLKKSFDDGDEKGTQFEFRYDMGGQMKDGVDDGSTTALQLAQRRRNRQLFKDFYVWVVTSTDEEFARQLNGWFVEASALYWYLFTERYTMMDNRAKNSFWHFANTGEYREAPIPYRYVDGEYVLSSDYMDYYYEATHFDSAGRPDAFELTSDVQVNPNKTYYWTYAFELWCYDTDSALGTDNDGVIRVPYGREDIDYYVHDDPSSGTIFNAADSTFWRRIRLLKKKELQDMYKVLETSLCVSAESLISEFDNWQAQFPEELWRLDTERKYYRPFYGTDGRGAEVHRDPETGFLLDMMNGRKKYQRRQFERDNEAYFATKYGSNGAKQNGLVFRCRAPEGGTTTVAPNYNLRVVPYTDMYLVLDAGENGTVSTRARAGLPYELDLSSIALGNPTDTQWILYWTPRIQELTDMSAIYLSNIRNIAFARKLKRLVIGNGTTGYRNAFLTTLDFSTANLPLLEYIDVRNVTNLSGGLNLTGCPGVKWLLAQGTGLTGFTFAPYGSLLEAYLPNDTTSLTLDNLHYITNNDLHLSYDHLTTLMIRDCSLDELAIISDSYDTLTSLRAYNINWAVNDLTMLNALAAIDSVLTGTLVINTSIGGQVLLGYRNKWKDLDITVRGAVIPQVLCIYYSDDTEDKTELCRVWIEAGDTPPDTAELISGGYIAETPTKETDKIYSYTFRDWKISGNTSEGLSPVYGGGGGNDVIEIYALFDTEYVNYTVRWCTNPPTGVNDSFLLVKTGVHYGEEVEYDLPDVPEDHSLDVRGIFRVFAGWDKCTANITENTDVVAIWEQGSPPNTKQFKGTRDLLSEMTVGEINAVVQTDQVDDYFDPADTVDIVLGHDFNFTNIDSDVLIGEGSILNLNDKVWFDGETAYDTGIRLFDENAPSFTLAVDFRASTAAANVLSCYEENGAEGFRLYRNGTDARIAWGDATVFFGETYLRDVVVIRHKKGSPVLNVYASNENVPSNYNYYRYRFSGEIFSSEMVRARETSTESTLVLGARKDPANGSYTDYFKGTIYWCKIWYDDIGDANARQLAAWPHELLRMNFIDKGRFELADNSGNTTNMSFIANNLLDDRSVTYAIQPTTYVSSSGATLASDKQAYPYTEIRRFLNTRFLNALPTVWNSLVKAVKLPCAAPRNEQNLIYCEDKIYIPAMVEVRKGVTGHMLGDEGTPISFFVSDQTTRPSFTVKHVGLPDAENAVWYSGSDDPKWENDVHDSDWWGTRKYKPEDWAREHYLMSNTSSMSVLAHDGGVWISPHSFFTRSHSSSGTPLKPGSNINASTDSCAANIYSTGTFTATWSSTVNTPVCLCFSI